jgi:hypothetical protein
VRNAEVIRQWQMLRAIESSRVGVTIHELAGEAGVSTRTIRRDLQALQEAGFAIFDEGEEHDTKRWKLNAQPFRAVEAVPGMVTNNRDLQRHDRLIVPTKWQNKVRYFPYAFQAARLFPVRALRR